VFLVFQCLFNFAEAPMDWIDSGMVWLQEQANTALPEGALRSLLVDGILAGVGSVVIFLPQILILFFFILLLEDSGYMARAAFMLDKLMGGVGLHGRAFIPLISSFACAIPGIMAARTIDNKTDRLVTILIAPLMTCSARLPVYALIIAAFIPNTPLLDGWVHLRGLVMFGLYMAGIISALLVAFIIKKLVIRSVREPFLMELPGYKIPSWRNLALGLLERAKIFLKRAGTVIFVLMVAVWVLSTYPKAPEGATEPAITYSAAGMIGKTLEPVFSPIGFNWQMVIALVPGLAAREVAVAALGTVYALSDATEEAGGSLATALAANWTLPAALSFLVWYIFAPQCLATLGVIRRETNSWKWPGVAFLYLTILAYVASYATYHLALHITSSN
jgi:ferrous iron transport protein B